VFAKPPFTYFEVTFYPITFCKNNPSFSVIIKIPLLLVFMFLKASHKHTSFTLTSTYFTLNNVPSFPVHELSQVLSLGRLHRNGRR
jgi:hypothetical protein